LTYFARVPKETALALQRIAASVVLKDASGLDER